MRNADRARSSSIAKLKARARAYVTAMERYQRSMDQGQRRVLEEDRVAAHNRFLDALSSAGITVSDRWEATNLAYEIVGQGRMWKT